MKIVWTGLRPWAKGISLKRVIYNICSPLVRNCITNKLMLRCNSSYILSPNVEGYVSADLGLVYGGYNWGEHNNKTTNDLIMQNAIMGETK